MDKELTTTAVTVEEAAASLGASKFKTFWKITIPMMFNGVAAGAIMTWVTLITELSSSVMLYSYKTITLNLLVYVLVVGGTDARACAASTILTLFMTPASQFLFAGRKKKKKAEVAAEGAER